MKDHIPLIEDSVDSLYELNTPLFCQGANFEIWSLPKILGTLLVEFYGVKEKMMQKEYERK